MRIKVQFSIQLNIKRAIWNFSIFLKMLMKYFSSLPDSGFFYNGSDRII